MATVFLLFLFQRYLSLIYQNYCLIWDPFFNDHANFLSENGSLQIVSDLYPLLRMNICLHILPSSSSPTQPNFLQPPDTQPSDETTNGVSSRVLKSSDSPFTLGHPTLGPVTMSELCVNFLFCMAGILSMGKLLPTTTGGWGIQTKPFSNYVLWRKMKSGQVKYHRNTQKPLKPNYSIW